MIKTPTHKIQNKKKIWDKNLKNDVRNIDKKTKQNKINVNK